MQEIKQNWLYETNSQQSRKWRRNNIGTWKLS